MTKKRKQVWGLVLSAALTITQLPTVAMAEESVPEDGSVASFERLDNRVKNQTVPVGTEIFDLNLPDILNAKIFDVTDEVIEADDDLILDDIILDEDDMEEDDSIASPSEADKSENHSTTSSSGTDSWNNVITVTMTDEEIPVTWDSYPVYDGDVKGNYVFTADVGSYILSEGVKLPQITVTVIGNTAEGHVPAVKNISGWSFVDDDYLNEGVLPMSMVSIDNQADFDTVVSMLPTQILAEIDNGESTAAEQEVSNAEAVEIISWNCQEYREDKQGNWPVSGEYTFTAELESGYRCNPLPSVKVLLGGASLFTINDRFAVDGLLYKELGPDTVQLMGYDWDKPKGELHIPSHVVKPENGRSYKVVSIGPWAFDYCRELTGSLVIPDTVTKIGKSAFSWCSFDGDLILPEGLTEIGDSAFYHSSFTGTLNLPDSLTEIGSLAFNECPGFTGPLVIPKQITVIQKGTFMACSGFESLTLPEGLIEIRNMGFTSLSSVKTPIIFPASLTLIGNSAFSGVSSCPEFICPTLTIADLLYECGSYIPNFSIKVGEVRYDQLQNKDSFKIGSNPAMNYVITGPDTVTAAGPGNVALYGILDIPQEVTNPADNITYTVTAIGDGAFRTQYITEVRIPDTVTKIGTGAFTVCENLTGTLELPAGLTSIGDAAFSRCTITGPLVIPDTVTEIGSDAFSSCQSIDSLTLPPGLTEIRERTFAYCYDLTGTLSLPPALTRIGSGAFTGCRNLSGPLNLPSGLTHIGEMAFSDCWSLTEAFLDKNITFIGWCAFNPNLPLTTNSPRVQLLINEYIIRANPVDTFWDGGEDIPDGALVTVNQDVTLDQDRRVGIEAEVTVENGVTLTTEGTLTVDGILRVNGKLIINGTLKGSGTLVIGRNGEVIGDISGMSVEYWDDMKDAKSLIETYEYSIPQYSARNAEAVKVWLNRKIAVIPGFSATGVNLGEITVTSFVPVQTGTNGSFSFDVLLTKGDGSEKAAASGIVFISESSDGEESYTNPDILHGTWEQTDNRIWMFRQTSGSYAKNRWGLIGGLWYYFNPEGHMLTGWQQIEGVWYYLNTAEDAGSAESIKAGMKEGAMRKGWHFDARYQGWFWFDTRGVMAIGWKEIDGKQYYFNQESDGTKGILLTNTTTPDGYAVNADGVWIK